MEIVTLILRFTNALKTYATLHKFIFGGEFGEVLDLIGGANARAAARALADKEYSSRPEREVESAVTSLREAYEIHPDLLHRCKFAASIALCYRFLGDKALTARYLGLCQENFDEWKRSELYHARYERGLTNDSYRESKLFFLIYGFFSPIEKVERNLNLQDTMLKSFVSSCVVP